VESLLNTGSSLLLLKRKILKNLLKVFGDRPWVPLNIPSKQDVCMILIVKEGSVIFN